VKIVLDTNVLVSGLLSPFGVPGEIVRMIGSSEITLCVDARIFAEYEEVINRPRFKFDANKTEALMDGIQNNSEIHPTTPLPHQLPDEDDAPFLAVSISSKASCLVTGNLKHYPANYREGVKVLTPVEFLAFYRKRRTRGS
jgi:uncharacterized protein